MFKHGFTLLVVSHWSHNCILDTSPSSVDASPSWDDASSKYVTMSMFQCKIWRVAELSWRVAELSLRVAELRWRVQKIVEFNGFLIVLAEGSLKSLRSVQISILEPKNYPRSSKNWSVLWKNFGHVGHQIVFQCEIWCGSIAKFVTLWIISVINRVASKNNLTTKPV